MSRPRPTTTPNTRTMSRRPSSSALAEQQLSAARSLRHPREHLPRRVRLHRRLRAPPVAAQRARVASPSLRHPAHQRLRQGIQNYPKQQHENGVAKHARTARRFKKMVRIVKKLRVEMDEAGIAAAEPIPSFLIESLVYRVPDDPFGGPPFYAELRSVLAWLYNNLGRGRIARTGPRRTRSSSSSTLRSPGPKLRRSPSSAPPGTTWATNEIQLRSDLGHLRLCFAGLSGPGRLRGRLGRQPARHRLEPVGDRASACHRRLALRAARLALAVAAPRPSGLARRWSSAPGAG